MEYPGVIEIAFAIKHQTGAGHILRDRFTVSGDRNIP
jgi:hypothetical protein